VGSVTEDQEDGLAGEPVLLPEERPQEKSAVGTVEEELLAGLAIIQSDPTLPPEAHDEQPPSSVGMAAVNSERVASKEVIGARDGERHLPHGLYGHEMGTFGWVHLEFDVAGVHARPSLGGLSA